MQAHRLVERTAELLDPLLLALPVVGLELDAPPAADGDRSVGRRLQVVPRLELAHALDDALLRRGREMPQQVIDGGPVEPRRLGVERHDRLHLGGEAHAPRVGGEEQRLDAEPVARDQERAAPRIPQREREHPTQALEAADAELLVEMDDDLDVAAAREDVALALELGAQRLEVVDLTVAHHPHRAVFVGDRLVAGGEVDDRQTAHAETYSGRAPEAFVVGAPMLDRIGHQAQLVDRDGSTVEANDARDSAHGYLTAESRGTPRRRESGRITSCDAVAPAGASDDTVSRRAADASPSRRYGNQLNR